MSKQDYSSPWKQMGTTAHAAVFGSKRKPEKSPVMATEKEIKSMRLKECDPYAKRFDSRISDNSLPLKKRNPRRRQ